jgi:hypothetical protein
MTIASRGALRCSLGTFLRRMMSIEYNRHGVEGESRRATGHRA